MIRNKMLWVTILLLLPFCLLAQTPDSIPPSIRNAPVPKVADSLTNVAPTKAKTIEPKTWWQEMLNDTEFMNSFIVTGFSFWTLVLIIWGATRTKGTFEPSEYIRLVVILFIIIASMFLIAAGFDDKQLAPAFGLLGTIAGYLLGRADSPKPPSSNNTTANSTPPSSGNTGNAGSSNQTTNP